MAAIEAIAVALGAAYIVLAIRQHRACWIAGGASTALFIPVFTQAGLPLQAALQVLYVVLSAYGWLQWRPGGARAASPRSWPPSRHLIALAGVGAVSATSAWLTGRFDLSTSPLADSLGTWASVVATWLLARRYVETWLWWIAIDAGLAALFAARGLGPTAALYVAYAALAAAGWRTWRKSMTLHDDPRVAAIVAELRLAWPSVTSIVDGPGNRVLRLRDARNDLVLRLAGKCAAELGANHEAERAMQERAAAQGLAPAVVMAGPGDGILVTRHVAGRELSAADLRDAAMLRRIGAWIGRLHAIPPPELPPVDFAGRAAGYLERLRARAPAPHLARIADRLAAKRLALAPASRLASCHHDLHRRNLIDTDAGLLAIDWEYAGPGDAAADLASCIGYHDLGPGEIAPLLEGYGDDSAALRARIESLEWIFACLWFGWNALAAHAGLAIDRNEQERLLAQLDC